MKKVFVFIDNHHWDCELCGSITSVTINVNIDEFSGNFSFDNHYGNDGPITSVEHFFIWLLNKLNVSVQHTSGKVSSCVDLIKVSQVEKILDVNIQTKKVIVSDNQGYSQNYLGYNDSLIYIDYLNSFTEFNLSENDEYDDEDCDENY